MTNKQRNFLFVLASKKGYKTESEKIQYLSGFFPKQDFLYYEHMKCNELDDKQKNYWDRKEQEKISQLIDLLQRKEKPKPCETPASRWGKQ